jgi:hypothetical protein
LNGLEIHGINKAAYLTKISLNYQSKLVQTAIITNMDTFLAEGKMDEMISPYSFFINFSMKFPIQIDLNEFILLFLKTQSITLLIDTLAVHISNLIKNIISKAAKKEFSSEKAERWAIMVANYLMTSDNDMKIHIIRDCLFGQYWTSSRHLALVSNTYITIDQFKLRYVCQNPISRESRGGSSESNRLAKTLRMIDWVKSKLSTVLGSRFEVYLGYLRDINYYKELDAQVQIRAAYLLKFFLEKYFLENKNTLKFDTVWNISHLNQFFQDLYRYFNLQEF